MRRQFMFTATLFLLHGVALGDLKITHKVIGEPVRVEVQDVDNPQVIHKFNLENGGSKTISITGLKCNIRVFSKGMNTLKTEGEFTPNQNLNIQASSGKWVLKRVSK